MSRKIPRKTALDGGIFGRNPPVGPRPGPALRAAERGRLRTKRTGPARTRPFTGTDTCQENARERAFSPKEPCYRPRTLQSYHIVGLVRHRALARQIRVLSGACAQTKGCKPKLTAPFVSSSCPQVAGCRGSLRTSSYHGPDGPPQGLYARLRSFTLATLKPSMPSSSAPGTGTTATSTVTRPIGLALSEDTP